MRESELANHLPSYLENDCKNIKFAGYIWKFIFEIIFHLPIIFKNGTDNVKKRARDI